MIPQTQKDELKETPVEFYIISKNAATKNDFSFPELDIARSFLKSQSIKIKPTYLPLVVAETDRTKFENLFKTKLVSADVPGNKINWELQSPIIVPEELDQFTIHLNGYTQIERGWIKKSKISLQENN